MLRFKRGQATLDSRTDHVGSVHFHAQNLVLENVRDFVQPFQKVIVQTDTSAQHVANLPSQQATVKRNRCHDITLQYATRKHQ